MESCEVTDHREPAVGARETPRTVSAGGLVNMLRGWLDGWLPGLRSRRGLEIPLRGAAFLVIILLVSPLLPARFFTFQGE